MAAGSKKHAPLKLKTHRIGKPLALDDYGEVGAEAGTNAADAATFAILMAFVDSTPPAAPKWVPITLPAIPGGGGAPLVPPYGSLRTLKDAIPAQQIYTPVDAGNHTVAVVIFDKGDDGNFRFILHKADEIQVVP